MVLRLLLMIEFMTPVYAFVTVLYCNLPDL